MQPWLKRLLRYSFNWLTVPIWGGPLKGKRWGTVTGSRFLRGTYEFHQTRAFQEVVQEGDTVYDIGAHVGYYSVLASGLVGAGGRVLSFEPLPLNLRHLRRHLRLNACDNVTVIEACVGDRSGTCRFRPGDGSGDGRVSENGSMPVRMVALDDLVCDDTIPPPDCMKIDVEGGEHAVLKGAQSLIATRRPTILLSIHGDEPRRQCFDFLTGHEYQLEPLRPAPLSEAREVLARGRR